MEPERGVENPGMGTNEGFKPGVLPGPWTIHLKSPYFLCSHLQFAIFWKAHVKVLLSILSDTVAYSVGSRCCLELWRLKIGPRHSLVGFYSGLALEDGRNFPERKLGLHSRKWIPSQETIPESTSPESRPASPSFEKPRAPPSLM